MSIHALPTRIAVCLAVLAAAQVASAAPASAGGLGGFLSPALGNGCANQHLSAAARGAAVSHPSAAGGNLLGVPVTGPLNQCGGADLPGVTSINLKTMNPNNVLDSLLIS
ncbi:hypothetical protein AB0F13_27455 [Streptomyces sp. NPDC026206]|uniref:hypothetical protein n=1 Tax=Streptomyces sp. NPDC026206 TaxID=3157089 RepID=UPI0033DD6EB8